MMILSSFSNFAAGMSGGIAYVLDEDNDLYMRTNKQMVFTEEVSNKYDVLELKEMIKEHVTLTNSEKVIVLIKHICYSTAHTCCKVFSGLS